MRLALALPLLLAFQDPADEKAVTLRWKLAKPDFARYRASNVVVDAKGVESLQPNSIRMVGLFGYEIADETRYAPPNLDAWEIPLIVGLSLPPKALKVGQAHDAVVELTDGWGYAPLVGRVTSTRKPSVTIDGASCVELEIKANFAPHPRVKPSGNQRAVDRASLAGTAHVDPAAGAVRRLRFTFQLWWTQPDRAKPVETFKQVEQIDLVAVLPPRHKEFEREVNAAIDKGVEWIWKQFNEKEGHWGAHYQFTTGPTALALLTVLKGTLERKDPRLRRALDWLLAQGLKHVYEVAISIMAVEAFYSPKDPGDRFKPGEVADPDIARRIEPAHAKWVSEAVGFLESSITSNTMWSYPDANNALNRDFSNTQYGVLGLFSGARCGAVLDASIYQRLLSTYLRAQQQKGPRVELALLDANPEPGRTQAKQVAEARGWMYREDPSEPPYESMTSGGISSLVILDSLMRRMGTGKYDRTDQQKTKAAIRDGWAWLHQNWSVKGNAPHGRDWYYYWLYGLERCGMLSGVAWIGERDWYYEGAQMLISNQAADGWWAHGGGAWFHDICFAVLFLKRATVKVASGK